jgi:hypothetical protein
MRPHGTVASHIADAENLIEQAEHIPFRTPTEQHEWLMLQVVAHLHEALALIELDTQATAHGP